MMQPQWWEPSNDNNDPNVADMSKFTFDSEGNAICIQSIGSGPGE